MKIKGFSRSGVSDLDQKRGLSEPPIRLTSELISTCSLRHATMQTHLQGRQVRQVISQWNRARHLRELGEDGKQKEFPFVASCVLMIITGIVRASGSSPA